MNGMADELLKLRFSAGPLQSLYLNEDRVNERFISHLGAITAWTRSAEKGGSGGIDLKLVKGEVKGGLGNQITYGVDNPLARALLLREALQTAGVVRMPQSATVGQYVIASGQACLRHPTMEEGNEYLLSQMQLAGCVPDTDPRYEQLELDRSRAEAVRLALAGPAGSNDRMWLLTLSHGDQIHSASVLNSRWLNDAIISYMNTSWTMFGTLREQIGGVPTLAAIHVWVTMPGDVMTEADVG
jgi:hypothetical protein